MTNQLGIWLKYEVNMSQFSIRDHPGYELSKPGTTLHFNIKFHGWALTYRKTSSKSRTKSQNLNAACILLQLSSRNLLKPGVQLIMKM